MATLAVAVGAGGCGKQSILAHASRRRTTSRCCGGGCWAAAAIVFFGAVAMLVHRMVCAAIRRGCRVFGEREGIAQGMVLVFGIAVPAVVLVALFGVSDVYLVGQTSPPARGHDAMTIDVIGHQWWWEVRYPGARAVTANEIHIPVDTRVNVVATTADVIHSFWVPALNRKIDLIPGQRNRILLDATEPGDYRGQCSEFCGVQHAHMACRGRRAAARRVPRLARAPGAPAARADAAPGARGRARCS